MKLPLCIQRGTPAQQALWLSAERLRANLETIISGRDAYEAQWGRRPSFPRDEALWDDVKLARVAARSVA